jgi:hypothetical protein
MSSNVDSQSVWECTFCGTQFVSGAADPGPNGEPRCPQCLIPAARPVPPEDVGEFVVMERTPFR